MNLRLVIMTVWLMVSALGAGPVLAFEQTAPAGPATAPLQSPGGAFDVENADVKRKGMSAPLKSEKKGLRSLGILPEKLDFGLELLYGAPDNSTARGHGLDDMTSDDMTILGRIKRRF